MRARQFRRASKQRDIVHRWEGNPLIRLDDLDFPCADIWSAGVAYCNNEIILLVTIAHLEGHQSIHLARADRNGRFHVGREPFLSARRSPMEHGPHESHAVMDARVTRMDDTHYIMYLAHGEHGYRLGLAASDDFAEVKRIGLVSEPDTKAGALFPAKIGGRYARLSRPRSGNAIWIAYSNDLTYWGKSESVLAPRPGFWDASRIGAGPPPIMIDRGWLLIYYGVKETSGGPLFRLGAAILDAEDPTRIVARSNVPILSPREDYERIGNMHNIVFSTGAFVEDGGRIQIVYSGADSCLCLGGTTVDEIVDTCMRSREEF